MIWSGLLRPPQSRAYSLKRTCASPRVVPVTWGLPSFRFGAYHRRAVPQKRVSELSGFCWGTESRSGAEHHHFFSLFRAAVTFTPVCFAAPSPSSVRTLRGTCGSQKKSQPWRGKTTGPRSGPCLTASRRGQFHFCPLCLLVNPLCPFHSNYHHSTSNNMSWLFAL